jgi:predicted metal-dependent hydrolase
MTPASRSNSIQLDPNLQPLAYSLRVSRRARRYRVIVSQDGVEVVLPYGTRLEMAEEILRSHAEWILAQLRKMERRRQRQSSQKLPPDVILMHGQPFHVVCTQSSGARPKVSVEKNRSVIQVHLPRGSSRHISRILEAWLRQQARPLIEHQVSLRAQAMGVRPVRVTIRDQRTRWGSCSSRGTLSFNWRLIMAPLEVMDYVVVHELCHILEPNHSRKFWLQVAGQLPDFKQPRLWLKRNANLLRPYK